MSDITVKLLKLISEDKTLNEISEILKLSQKQIFNYLTMIKNRGYDFNRHYFHDGNIKYSFIHQYGKPLNKEIIFSKGVTKLHAIVISDTHIGSNFERLDLLNEVYEYCSKNSINIIFSLIIFIILYSK